MHARVAIVASCVHLGVVLLQGDLGDARPQVLLRAVGGCVVVFMAELPLRGLGMQLFRDTTEEQDGPRLIRLLWVHLLVDLLQVLPEFLPNHLVWLPVRRVVRLDVCPVDMFALHTGRQRHKLAPTLIMDGLVGSLRSWRGRVGWWSWREHVGHSLLGAESAKHDERHARVASDTQREQS